MQVPRIEKSMDYAVMFIMAVILIIGFYQFYFWCQRNNLKKPVSLHCFMDNLFTYRPKWVWIYSGIYYPIIVFTVFSFSDFRQFNYTVMSYVILLVIQMSFFVFFPVQTPAAWRQQVEGNSLTHKFIAYVQSLDKANNCFPSMHVSVSTLTSLHLAMNYPAIGPWIWLFPLLIALSALYTKQHYFMDLVPGALVGWLAFKVFLMIYA